MDESSTVEPGPLESVALILAAGLDMLFLYGLCYNSGILIAEWMDYFGKGGGLTSWIGTAVVGVALCFSPVASMLVRRFGLRLVAVISSLTCGLSIAASSLAPNIYVILVFWVLAGACMAVHVTPVLSYIVTRFKSRRAIANGIVTAGTSIGTFIYPVIMNSLLNSFGWRGCVLILGGLSLNVVPISLVYKTWGSSSRGEKKLLNEPTNSTEINETELISSAQSLRQGELRKERINSMIPRNCGDKTLGNVVQTELFRNRFFVMMLIHTLLFYMAVSVTYIHIVAGFRAVMNLTVQQSRFTITALGICNLISRILISILVHQPSIDTYSIYVVCGLLTGIIAIAPVCSGFIQAIILCSALGFTLSGYGCLLQVVFVELLGEEFIQMAFSYSQFTGGIGYTIGAPIAGWLYDVTRDYSVSFYFGGGFAIAGMAILIPDWLIHLRRLCKGTHKQVELSLETKEWLQSHLSLT
ncbi:monocarboxylate transporter 14-like [Tubulanus polymorphus]|uniref:monocarboxylate transporter 14-like n=1 Tax=Tubulanus polymorphus TaxID=672921 RepID=UPI003DA33A03